MDLTKGDYDVLIEAVDEWKNADTGKAMIMSMIGSMSANSKEERQKIITEIMEQAAETSKGKEEIATCLKAKLYLMKNAMEATDERAH